MSGNVLRLEGVERSYRMGRDNTVRALRGVSLSVDEGEFVAIVGPSGSGKTTLLNIAGLLDHPDAGRVSVAGRSADGLKEADRARMRRESIGFIFQTFNLLPHLTAEENVALPLRYADPASVRTTPRDLLDRVGLGQRLGHRPDELSGGEQQRVAIARALMADPPLILADEPTGDLDSETASGIIDLLDRLRVQGKALVVVTHNEELARQAGRLVHMRDGTVVDDTAVAAPPEPEPPRTARRMARGRAGEPKAKPKAAPKKVSRAQPKSSKKGTNRRASGGGGGRAG